MRPRQRAAQGPLLSYNLEGVGRHLGMRGRERGRMNRSRDAVCAADGGEIGLNVLSRAPSIAQLSQHGVARMIHDPAKLFTLPG